MTIAAAGGQATASKCTSDLVKDKVVKCKLLLRDIASKTLEFWSRVPDSSGTYLHFYRESDASLGSAANGFTREPCKRQSSSRGSLIAPVR